MHKVETYGPIKALHQGKKFLGFLPPLMTVRCYAVDGLLIDSGLYNKKAQLLHFAQKQKIARAVITHHHEDHSGNCKTLVEQGMPVLASPATATIIRRGFEIRWYQRMIWGVAPATATQTLDDTIETSNHRFQVLPAPGHCDDQIVLYEAKQGWLFSGDAFLAEQVKLFRGDEDFDKTVQSLQKLTRLDFAQLFCAHRPNVKDGKAALQRKLNYLLEIAGKVRALYASGLSLKEITRQVLGKEKKLMFLCTWGDMSKRNLVRSILYGAQLRENR